MTTIFRPERPESAPPAAVVEEAERLASEVGEIEEETRPVDREWVVDLASRRVVQRNSKRHTSS